MMRFIVATIALSLCSACGLLGRGGEVDQSMTRAEEMMRDAVNTLEAQSEDWQAVLTQLEQDLLTEGRQDLADDVNKIASRAIGTTSVNVRCNVDFVGDEMQAFVGKMVASALSSVTSRAFDNMAESALQPRTCNVSPEGTLSGDRIKDGDDREVIWYGYNFYEESPADAGFTVTLQNVSTSTSTDISSRLAVTTHYQMGLNLYQLDLSLTPDNLYKVQVYHDGVLFSEINVSPPTPPAPIVHQVNVVGTIDLFDHEDFSSNEHAAHAYSQSFTLNESTLQQSYSNTWCLGGEVRGELAYTITLDPGSGNVVATVDTKYYEGESCGTTDLERTDKGSFTVGPGNTVAYQKELKDGDGHANWTLNFTNLKQ